MTRKTQSAPTERRLQRMYPDDRGAASPLYIRLEDGSTVALGGTEAGAFVVLAEQRFSGDPSTAPEVYVSQANQNGDQKVADEPGRLRSMRVTVPSPGMSALFVAILDTTSDAGDSVPLADLVWVVPIPASTVSVAEDFHEGLRFYEGLRFVVTGDPTKDPIVPAAGNYLYNALYQTEE